MLKEFKIDKVNGIALLEVAKKDLRNIMDSVDNMVDKQRTILLENIPSKEEDRRKLEDYEALKEELRKVWELLA